VGGALKWAADQWAARKQLGAEEKLKFDERGTLLASGFIAGEAITGILLAALFLTGVSSITKVVTGLDELPFLANWGGWISLVAFALITYILIQVPLRKFDKVGGRLH
jgi:Zn-dependent protease